MEIKENNIIFLLGAGCSKEAEIPISNEMVTKVQEKLNNESAWKPYTDLYFYLKSSINYSDGIFGNFDNTFNIEKLLIVMGQIEKRDKNIIYPFIGSWNIRLPEVAGKNFERITELKQLINQELFEWVTPKDLVTKAQYYEGFKRFSNEVGITLRVFSLNYDQCFEKVIGEDNVEQGFDPKTFEWQQSNFEGEASKLFKLYKLHGSINWFTDKHTGKLMHSNHPITQDPKLIFGIDTKLSSSDPFFYYTSEFRRWILSNDCKLIVTIGYSYADEYINNLIAQSLINNPSRQVLNVTYLDKSNANIERLKNDLTIDITKNKLELKHSYNELSAEQFLLHIEGAKDFLNDTISTNFLSKYIKDDNEAPFKEN
jgi:SIR2-like domain